MSNNTITNTSSIVSKVWAFCNTLRDDALGNGVYVKHLIMLQFIKVCLSFADKMEESITKSMQLGQALRQSILKKAFEGRLV